MCIPDIHGRDYWKSFPKQDFDVVIFLGDYTDSFDKSDKYILDNLQNIIEYKKNNVDKTILLLGNHDLQYYFSYASYGCTGFRVKMYVPLHSLFQNNKELFKPIHVVGNYIFSHAGITSVWYKKLLKEIEGTPYADTKDLEELITALFYKEHVILSDVGRTRGGWCKSGGPFWADLAESKAWMLKDFHQVVGHTPIKEIFTHEWKEGNSSITYCDSIYDYHEITVL